MYKILPWLFVIIFTSSCTSLAQKTNSVQGTPVPDKILKTETQNAQQEFMAPCLKINNLKYTNAAVFSGLIPGQTDSDEVSGILGQPNQIYNDLEQENFGISWSYSNVKILIQNDIVEKIIVYDQNSTLLSMIEEYGCPEAIFIIGPGDENTEGKTTFIYYSIGLELLFEGTDLDTSDKPISVFYSVPTQTLSKYMDREGFGSGGYSGPIPWSQVVRN
jgi:hypothetical protein